MPEEPPRRRLEPDADTPEDAGDERGSHLLDERAHRLRKLDALREEGIDPYPVTFARDHTLAEVRDEFGHLEDGAETDSVVRVAGRVMLKRGHGKLSFATIRDRSAELQLFVSEKLLGDDAYRRFGDVDRGD